jgi:hypothetical protein
VSEVVPEAASVSALALALAWVLASVVARAPASGWAQGADPALGLALASVSALVWERVLRLPPD